MTTTKNRFLTFFLTLILALTLTACGGNTANNPSGNESPTAGSSSEPPSSEPATQPPATEPDITEPPTETPVDPNEAGNIFGNIGHDNLNVAYKDGWVYYGGNVSVLCKIRTDGTEKTTLYDGRAYYINIIGDWVYFSSGGLYADKYLESALFKVRTDGTELTLVTEDNVSTLYVIGEWAYYWNRSDGYTPYKIRTDGTERTKLSDDECGGIVVDDGWIFYRVYVNDVGYVPYKMRLDGTEKTKLPEDIYSVYCVVDGWIYDTYASIKDNSLFNSLYKMRIDGTERTDLVGSTDSFGDFNVVGDWIYYTNMDGLHKIRTDGTGEAQLSDDDVGTVCVAGDWIIYMTYDMTTGNSSCYKIRTDGSDRQLFDLQ